MPFTIRTFEQIRDDLLRDIRNLNPEADVTKDSDFYIRATSVASAIEGLYQHQSWIVRQIFPDTADREYLEWHARMRGLSRKAAVAASGQVELYGTPGTAIASGLSFKWNGLSYTTTSSAQIDANGRAMIDAVALATGPDSNTRPDVVAELTAAPSGITSQVRVINMTGGVVEETDGELLARLLEVIRRPPAGGNKYDYRRWALEVPGVTAAYVYPLRRGLGTVDVVITSGAALPSVSTVSAVQAHIDDQRCVTAKHSLVLVPTLKTYDVEVAVALDGLTLDAAKAQISAALFAYDSQIAPAETAVKSRLETIVSSVAGVTDRAINQPAANVVPVADAQRVEWARIGQVTVRRM